MLSPAAGIFDAALARSVLRCDERSHVSVELLKCKAAHRAAMEEVVRWKAKNASSEAHLEKQKASSEKQQLSVEEERIAHEAAARAEYTAQAERHKTEMEACRADLTRLRLDLKRQTSLRRMAQQEASQRLEALEHKDAKIKTLLAERQRAAAAAQSALAEQAEGFGRTHADLERRVAEAHASMRALERHAAADVAAGAAEVGARDATIAKLQEAVRVAADESAAQLAQRDATIHSRESDIETLVSSAAGAEKEYARSAARITALEGTKAEQEGRIVALTAEVALATASTSDEMAAHLASIQQRDETIRALEESGRRERAASVAAVAERDAACASLRAQVDELAAARTAAEERVERGRKAADDAAAASALQVSALQSAVSERDVTMAAATARAEQAAAAAAALIAKHEATIGSLSRAGRLCIHLSHAVDLRAADGATSDPFVVMDLGGRTAQSVVVRKTLSPRWDADFVFGFENVEAAMAETLGIEAWDYDEMSDNDKLGAGNLKLVPHRSALEGGETIECKVPLEFVKGVLTSKAVSAGHVVVKVSWEKSNAHAARS